LHVFSLFSSENSDIHITPHISIVFFFKYFFFYSNIKLIFTRLPGWDDFRTFEWLNEVKNLDDVLEESRILLKI